MNSSVWVQTGKVLFLLWKIVVIAQFQFLSRLCVCLSHLMETISIDMFNYGIGMDFQFQLFFQGEMKVKLIWICHGKFNLSYTYLFFDEIRRMATIKISFSSVKPLFFRIEGLSPFKCLNFTRSSNRYFWKLIRAPTPNPLIRNYRWWCGNKFG